MEKESTSSHQHSVNLGNSCQSWTAQWIKDKELACVPPNWYRLIKSRRILTWSELLQGVDFKAQRFNSEHVVGCLHVDRLTSESLQGMEQFCCSPSAQHFLCQPKQDALFPGATKMMARASHVKKKVHMEQPGLKTHSLTLRSGSRSLFPVNRMFIGHSARLRRSKHCPLLSNVVRDSYKPSMVSINFLSPPQATCVRLSKSLALFGCN